MGSDEQRFEKKNIRTNGIVLYPRQYHVDGDNPSNSYVEGVSHGGTPVVAYLSIKSDDQERAKSDDSKVLPSISGFAQKKPASRTRCLAAEDNGPDNAQGVLLVEQVSKVQDQSITASHPGKFVCNAHWMSILQQDDYLPCRVSPGYVEVDFSHNISDELKSSIARYRSLYKRFLSLSDNDDSLSIEQQMDDLQAEIIANRKNFFKAVCLDPGDIRSFSFEDNDNNSVPPFHWLKETLREVLEARTYQGMYGSALIRIRSGKEVSPLYCTKIEMRYDFSNKVVRDFDSVFDNWSRYDAKDVLGVIQKIPSGKPMVLEIIPAQQINLGWRSYDRYNNDLLRLSSSKYLKTFVDSDSHRFAGVADLGKQLAYRYAMMALRTTETTNDQEGNVLVSAFHAYSAPIDSPFLIDKNGYKLEFTSTAKNEISNNKKKAS